MPKRNLVRYDRKLTAAMVDDFIHDPVLAAECIFGFSIPPHQELRIMLMWVTGYTQDDSGFSTGKSFTIALVSALRSILFSNRISGIVSGSFRQGKLIFSNYDRWYNNCSIFRNSVQVSNGKQRIIHGNEAHEIFYRNGSESRVLPPDFSKDSTRLQSERWHDGYFDEWPSFNIKALSKTLFGRVTAFNKNQECPIRRNHIHLLGTPGFTYWDAYRLVRQLQKHVASGNTDYAQFTCNYRHVPDDPRWNGFVDRKTIFTMQTMNPIGVVESEINGLWQSDSLSYYSSKSVDDCRVSTRTLIGSTIQGGDVFVFGFDSSSSGTARGNNDDFALTVLKIRRDLTADHVLTVRRNGISSRQAAAIVHKYAKIFFPAFIVYDPGGGGLFVRDELRESKVIINDILTDVVPILEPNDISGAIGNNNLIPFKRGCWHLEQMWGKAPSDSVYVNRMHRIMKGLIESEIKQIRLASKWDGWELKGAVTDVTAKREFLNRASSLTEQERVLAEMDLAVSQLILVDVMRDKESKEPIIDSFGMYKFGSKRKKDSAYSLAYAAVARELFIALGSGQMLSGGDGDVSCGIGIIEEL